MPERSRQSREVHLLAPCRVVEERRPVHGNGRVGLQRLPLLHPGLQGIEGLEMWIDAERQGSALRRRGGVGEDTEAGRKTLDAVEQERRTVRHAGGDLGDAADLAMWIGALDAAQGSEGLDRGDEVPQIAIACTHLISLTMAFMLRLHARACGRRIACDACAT